jgi:tRNA threonylcarbamoyladenosine biosynthesis protein TsaE
MTELAEWKCGTPDALQALARALGTLHPRGVCIGLLGDLGAGKTTFTQGLGQGLGIGAEITSPTFALMVEYEAGCPLLHVDAYRLSPGESAGIGLEEALEDWPGVAVVEWADLVAEDLPIDCLFIRLTIEPDTRRVEAWTTSERLKPVLRRWRGEA